MMRWALFAVVAGFSAFAQGTVGPASGGVTRGNFLRIPAYETPGTATLQSYFVDGALGNDSNTCTASGTSACLTIQAALNKVPKLLRDQATVNVAAGTYAGFIISDFTSDNGPQQTSGGLLVVGGLSNSTLATGTATGTATAGTAGSGSTFGTLTDGAQSWTVNDLRGRMVTTVSPTNTAVMISSNTATVITVVGIWNAPTGATTYTIQDPNVILNTSLSRPATPLSAASANRAAIQVLGNTMQYRSNAIVIQNMRFAPASGSGLNVNDNSNVLLQNIQSRAGGGGLTIGFGAGSLTISASEILVTNALTGILQSGGVVVLGGANGSGNRIGVSSGTGATALLVSAPVTALPTLSQIGQVDISGYTDAIAIPFGVSTGAQNNGAIVSSRIDCASGAGVAFKVGSPTTNISGMAANFGSITSTNVTTCGTAVQVVGPAAADVVSLTGSVGTTGFAVTLGGLISFAKAGTTITAGTNEINLDTGLTTAAFTDVAAATCLSTAQTGSKVCGR